MKVLMLCVLYYLSAVNAAVLPDVLSAIVCRKSEDDYGGCLKENLEKARPYFMNGVPELDFPGLDPLVINRTTVDRTLNELVSIKAVLKNVRVVGMRNIRIDDLKANPHKMVGEIRLTIPHVEMVMEHDVTGQLLVIPLQSKGYFKGNFSDIQIYMRAQFKRYQREGVDYFAVEKFDTKSVVGDGFIKIISKNPNLQFSADLITNFYNENPRLVMDAINPIYNEYSNSVIKQEINNYLAKIPADEFLPA